MWYPLAGVGEFTWVQRLKHRIPRTKHPTRCHRSPGSVHRSVPSSEQTIAFRSAKRHPRRPWEAVGIANQTCIRFRAVALAHVSPGCLPASLLLLHRRHPV